MKKRIRHISTTLPPDIRSAATMLDRDHNSGDNAKELYLSLSKSISSTTKLKKTLKKSHFKAVVKNFIYGAALYLDNKKDEALPLLIDSQKSAENWFINYLAGLCLIDFNRIEDAKPIIDKGIKLNENSADLWHLAGVYHQTKQDEKTACNAYKRSIEIEPNRSHTLTNLATGLEKLGQLTEALEHSSRALELTPNALPLLHNHAHILTRLGKFKEATILFEHIAKQTNASPISISSFFYNQLFNGEKLDLKTIEKNIVFGKSFLNRYNPIDLKSTPLNGRRLRVGYISGDFKRHSCSFFIEPILKHHTSQIETFCFSLTNFVDQFTHHLAQLPDHWFDMSQLTDQKVTEFIRSKELDILVDLSGHTAHNRLSPLCERAAPIQMNYLGFPRSTWLPTIDYRLVDWHTDPEGYDSHTTESLLRLPESFLTYQPLFGAPPIEEPPCLQNEEIIFGSFNNPLKLSDETLRLWQLILHEVPNSKLMLKGILFRHEFLRNQVIERFAKHKISAEQLLILPPTEGDAEHLSSYNKMDIGLDPFPYHGTTTTFEALLMGTPVISLCGEEHMSRVGKSILSNIGAQELIAQSDDEYIEIAKSLAKDRKRVLSYKSSLRDRLLKSTLCNHQRFVSFLERIYFHVHEHHCNTSRSNMSA